MQLDQLVLNCPRCDSWYTESNAPISDFDDDFRKVFSCNCNGGHTKLNHAYECNLITPYQEMQLEFLRGQRNSLYASISRINKQIEDITGMMDE